MQLDYYVYNGIHEAADAFQRLALIFGDNSFLVFVGIFAMIGVMAGGLLAAHKGLTGQQGNPLTWAIPILFGLILFKAFVIPTGTLHIYDPVKNAYQPVDDVPDIVILLAGGLNRVERGIVDIVDTASAFPYADGAGSLRFTLLLAALNAPEIDVNLSRSIERYFADCGTYAIATNRDGVTLQELKRNTTDLRTTFSKFAHGGLFTVYYPPGNDGGDPMTCAAAWDQLSTRLNNQNNYLELRKGACDTAGFNPEIPTQLQRCDQLLEEAANIYSPDGSAVGLYTLLSNIVLARSTANALSNSEYAMNQRDSIARQNFVQSLNASESLAQWVPKLRGFMVATIVGLVPLVLLLIVTPLIGRAIALICGMFVWLTLWGITDAVAAQMAADAATRSFANLKSFGLGYDAIINSPQAAIEAQGLFGKARSMALMLATFLAAALFKFGGYAFTHVAQGWQDSLQGGEGGKGSNGSGGGQPSNDENIAAMGAMGMFGSSPAMAAAGGKATPQSLSAGAMREAMVNDSLAGMQPAGRSFVGQPSIGSGSGSDSITGKKTGAMDAASSGGAASPTHNDQVEDFGTVPLRLNTAASNAATEPSSKTPEPSEFEQFAINNGITDLERIRAIEAQAEAEGLNPMDLTRSGMWMAEKAWDVGEMIRLEMDLRDGTFSDRQVDAIRRMQREDYDGDPRRLAFKVSEASRITAMMEALDTQAALPRNAHKDYSDAYRMLDALSMALVSEEVYYGAQFFGGMPEMLPDHIRRVSFDEITDMGISLAAFSNAENGYQGALYYDSRNDEYILANQGTNIKELADGKADILNALGMNSEQYRFAVDLAHDLAFNEHIDGRIRFTGHSLGGAVASAQAARVDREAVAFNPAGLSQTVVDNLPDITQLQDNVSYYVVEGEVVDRLNALEGTPAAVGTRYELDVPGMDEWIMKGGKLVADVGEYMPGKLEDRMVMGGRGVEYGMAIHLHSMDSVFDAVWAEHNRVHHVVTFGRQGGQQ